MRRAPSLAAPAGLPFAALRGGLSGSLRRLLRAGGFAALRRALQCAVLPSAILALVALLLGAPETARAGELVVFERPGCAYCQKFERDVMPIYDKTEEGRRAPLRRVDLSAGVPQDMTLALPVRFTPTFVVVEGGREIGRITGYASDEAFWGLLGALTARLAPDRP